MAILNSYVKLPEGTLEFVYTNRKVLGLWYIELPIGSMVLLYMLTWIPSIYPSHVSINIPTPWIRHGLYRSSQTSAPTEEQLKLLDSKGWV